MKKYNSIYIGVLIGVLSVFLSFIVFYLIRFNNISLTDYFGTLFHNKGILSPLLSLAGIPNLVFFYLFINKNKYKTARGIILATFILVLAVVLVKIFM